jgi:superfamily II DNA/RNA helicase
LFSNTIPTDVINFSQSLQVRDPARVLVRREGSTNSQESVSSITPGINLKHTYVYLTITGSARFEEQSLDSGPGTIGSGRANSGSSEEAPRGKEYKLEMLVKMLDDYPLWQAVIHVGTYAMLDAVVYQLQSRNWDTLYLASDMPPAQRKAVLQQWRMSSPGAGPRFLVCFDVTPKPPDIPWAPLVINFDLPRSVEGYALRAAAAVPPAPRPGQPQPPYNGVIVSFVQAAGGDVEMLRSTECAYRFKSAEIPAVFHDLF